MRNTLLALTTGLVAGQAFALYREMKLKRIAELEMRVEELTANVSPAIHSPDLPTIRGGHYRA